MGRYMGLTIGPIVDTLGMVAKPAGLWGASYLFSYTAEKICLGLMAEGGVGEGDFLAPAVGIQDGKLALWYQGKEHREDAALLMREEGVGLLHDRIIWKASGEETIEKQLQDVNRIVEKAKEAVAEAVLGSGAEKELKQYIVNYIQVQGVGVDVETEENPQLKLSKYLDALDLQKQVIPRETTNVVLEYLDNKKVKETAYFPKGEKFPLLKKDEKSKWVIRDIEDICKAGRESYKTEKYFAIVQADGDNIGGALKQMSEEKLRSFSTMCIQIAAEASQIVKNYGGYMIYAGGDDLLFLAPLVGKNGKDTILNLLYQLSGNFQKIAEKEFEGLQLANKPTLSFGVSVQYYKYPLYEAFAEGRKRLFAVAKNSRELNKKVPNEENNGEKEDKETKGKETKGKETDNKEKDIIAVNLRKHSGQSVEFYLREVSKKNADSESTGYHQLLEGFFKTDGQADMMNSVYRLLKQFSKGLTFAFEQKEDCYLEELFKNVFDNAGQKVGQAYIDQTKALALAFKKNEKYKSAEEKQINFLAFLKFVQFYFEKGEE